MSPVLGIIASANQSGRGTATGAYEAIATVTASGTVSSISFTAIPQGYRKLELRIMAKTDRVANLAACANCIQFNGDSSSNYNWEYMRGDGTNASIAGGGGANASYVFAGWAPGTQYTTGLFDVTIATFPDYASSTKNKSFQAYGGEDNNQQNGPIFGTASMFSGGWRNTVPITSMYIFPVGASANNYTAGTTFALYGVK